MNLFSGTVAITRLCIVFLFSLCAVNSAWSQDNPPSTPELSFSIYSGTDAELFWTRATGKGVDLTYILSRDGEVVFQGDGLSYYESSLNPGQIYRYELMVQDASGLNSDTVDVGFDTNDRFLIGQESVLPPTGLRADIYSSTALELFWDRVQQEARNYDIRLNGISVGTTDGTSFFINSGLSSDQINHFEVTAIRYDNPGIAYSEPAVLFVNMADGSTSSSRPLFAPQNVQLAVYSNTAAELFWERAPTEQNVRETDVIRNGERLASVPGTSFFDSTREPGVGYSYELIAVNDNSERSTAASFVEEGFIDPAIPDWSVNETNLPNIVNNVARIVSGNVYNDLVAKAQDFATNFVFGLTLQSESDRFPGATVQEIYQCESGGQLTRSFPISAGLIAVTITIENCILAGELFNGGLRYENSASGEELVMTDFQRTYVNGDITTISGSLIRPFFPDVHSLQVFSYSELNADGTRRPVENFRTTSVNVSDEDRPGVVNTLFTSWTASGPFSEDTPVKATTLTEFDRMSGDTEFTRGKLLLEIEDIATITWNADNSDNDSFQITVEQAGIVDTYTLPWDDNNRLFLAADFR